MQPNPFPIAFLAEANHYIGTGHVVEMLQLAERCSDFELKPYLWFNDRTPPDLLSRAQGKVRIVQDMDRKVLEGLISQFREDGIRALVTNFRSITRPQIEVLKGANVPLICIDELGERFLNPDVIINNSIVSAYHCYPGTTARIYAGPRYMCMNEGFRKFSNIRRSFQGGIRRLVISMGGTDPSRATLRVIDALATWKPDVEKHVVAGPGFDFVDRLEEKLDSVGENFCLHRSPPSLVSLLADADMGITVGGNTLYEMACVGTPALVLYEEPHECVQGETFAKKGFGICVGSGLDAPLGAIQNGLNMLDTEEVLSAHSVQGRVLVDGLGVDRILQIVEECIQSSAGPSSPQS